MDKDQSQIGQKKARRWIYLGVAFFVFSLLLIIFVYILVKNLNVKQIARSDSLAATSTLASKEVAKVARLIDGVMVAPGTENLPPIAIMIDNHYDARPPAGIDRAQLVFEADVEGGITRLMAFFASDEEIEEIGPVRSARPYFVDWATEYTALYAHVGGSPEALAKMIDEDTFHINEFYNGDYFWRASDRIAPHNVMTSSALLKEYLADREVTEGVFLPWTFVDETDLAKRPQNQEISIEYRRSFFNVIWKYDAANDFYIRYQAGEPHETSDGEIITARNVIILRMESEEIDEKLRLKMSDLGEGEAIVCHDGTCQTGTWRKLSNSTRMRFYDENNKEIPLLRGNIWIQVVGTDYEVEY